MPEQDPAQQLKDLKEKSAKLKGIKKHAEDAKKLLAQLTKVQTAGKTAKKELEGESDAE